MPTKLKEKLEALLDELYFLQMDWSYLGWDFDGCPDGDKCSEFDNKLARINSLRQEVSELLKKVK